MKIQRISLLFAIAGCVMIGQTAEGYLKVGTTRKELRYARAAHVPDRFDKAQRVLHVVLSDAPLPTKALFDGLELFSLTQDSDIQVIEFDFQADGGGVNWYFKVKGIEGSMSMSQSPNPFPYEEKNGVVRGKMEAKGETPGSGHVPYELKLSYSAPIETEPVEAPPTPAETAAAQKSPATKMYLDLQDAIRKGDKARILAAAPEEQRRMMDTPDFPKMLEFVQGMQPKDLKVLKVQEKGDEATLWISGTQDGKAAKGEATLKRIDGKWYMTGEKWRD